MAGKRGLAIRLVGSSLVWLLLILLAPALLPGCGQEISAFPTEYQAVFLDNGQVFFGKIEKIGPSYITLRDVFYVRTQVDREKKQAKNILVKRGLEWHAPDFMYLNTRHVVLIEPVAPGSQVAQLIRQFKKGPPPVPPKAQEEKKPAPAPQAPEEKQPAAPKPKANKRPPGAR